MLHPGANTIPNNPGGIQINNANGNLTMILYKILAGSEVDYVGGLLGGNSQPQYERKLLFYLWSYSSFSSCITAEIKLVPLMLHRPALNGPIL